jgi:hypothetical protein
MREEMVKVTPLKPTKAEVKLASQKSAFEEQEAKRNKMHDRINAARERGRGGGGSDTFSRTQSVPDAPSDAGAGAARGVMGMRQTAGAQSPPDLEKDELRPMQKHDKAKLQRNRTTAGVFADKSGKKTASDRYHEMAQPWIGMLRNSPKERRRTPERDQFSEASSEDDSAVADVGFSRTQSAPAVAAASPQRGGDEVKEICIQPETGPMFSRTKSAPDSGYVNDEFLRLPSTTSEEMAGELVQNMFEGEGRSIFCGFFAPKTLMATEAW